MRWQHYIISALVLLSAGFMTFDGVRAFVVGDYVTPKSGPHAGQLGPWSKLVKVMGIEPRSGLMKGIHVLCGATMLVFLACFLMKISWASTALLIGAVACLWYLPVGTVLNAIVIVLLLWTRRKLITS